MYKRFTVLVLFFRSTFKTVFWLTHHMSTSEPLLPCCSSRHPYPQQINNIYMHKKFGFSAFLSFCLILVSSCFVVVFLAVPSQVLTSEPLLPQCSSRHPYPQQRNIYMCKRFTVLVLFFLFV